MSLDELYQDLILDHFKCPRCRGTIEKPDAQFSIFNPLCGDEICIQLRFEGTGIAEVAQSGHGCAISQAAASMLSELCKGKSKAEAKTLLENYRKLMVGDAATADLGALSDAAALQGVRKFAARVKCAMLACEALDKCLS